MFSIIIVHINFEDLNYWYFLKKYWDTILVIVKNDKETGKCTAIKQSWNVIIYLFIYLRHFDWNIPIWRSKHKCFPPPLLNELYLNFLLLFFFILLNFRLMIWCIYFTRLNFWAIPYKWLTPKFIILVFLN